MAKDGEVTPLISTLSGIELFFFLRSHESQVADPVIEAVLSNWHPMTVSLV